jgi:hypothetical protein
MRVLAIALLVLVAATAASAQAVTVRAGDHDGFTRLVLRLPSPANWRLGRTDTGYELRIESPGVRFDLSRVFDVITRRRVESVWVDPVSGNLVIGVPCACHAVAYASTPTLLVIDIRSGPADPASGFERRLDGQEASPLPGRSAAAPPRPRPRPGSPARLTVPEPSPLAYDWRRRDAPMLSLPVEATAGALRLRASIEAEIARAAGQGLVDPIDPIPEPEPAAPPASITVAGPEPAGETGARGTRHMRVIPDGAERSDTLTADGRDCIPDEALSFLREPSDTTLRSVSAAWAEVLDPLDRPDAEAAATLARRYLSLGFGAEARAVLRSFNVGPRDAAVLGSIADFLEGDRGHSQGAFAGMEVCDGDAALWAMLTEPPRRGAPLATEAVIRAFSALPMHLRQIAGPPAAERFLARGDAASARAIRNALARTGSTGEAVRLIDAELSAAAGDTGAADRGFRDVATGNGPNADRALARLADSIVDRGGAIDADMLVALAAAAYRQGDGPDAAAVARAYARALAAGGDFGAAFAVASASGGAATADVWALLAARGDAAALLRHATLPPADVALPPATKLGIAERLLEIGMPELVGAWTAGLDDARARLADARAAIQLRDGRAALRALAGVDGDEGGTLRAQALTLLGDAAAAAEAWVAAGNPDEARAVAWRAQDWALFASLPATASASPVLGELLDAASGPEPAASQPSGPATSAPTLADARRLLGDASERRAAIERLLSEVPAPDATGLGRPDP